MTVANTAEVANRSADPAYADQVRLFWLDSVAWVSSHSLRILIGGLVATLIVLVLMAVKAGGVRLCRTDPGQMSWRTTIGRALSKTKFWFMVAVAAQLVARFANAPDLVATTIKFGFTIAVALQVAIWLREIVIGVIEHRAGGEDHSNLGSAIGIIRLLVTIVIFAFAILMILDNLGVNVTGLVAGLGIGGIAIGLAAKGIFDDLFSALSIIFDKPFARGEVIKWGTTVGKVEAIGLKTTRVRATTGEEVIISNTNLLDKELHNMARLSRRRQTLGIGVIYQTPPEVCAQIPDMIKEIVEAHDQCVLVHAGMTGFGASSLDYEIQFDVETRSADTAFAQRHAVCIAILDRFAKEGIEFAYPTQTSFTAAPDGTIVMPYAVEAKSSPVAAREG